MCGVRSRSPASKYEVGITGLWMLLGAAQVPLWYALGSGEILVHAKKNTLADASYHGHLMLSQDVWCPDVS